MSREEQAVGIVRGLAAITAPLRSDRTGQWCGACGETMLDPDDNNDPDLHADSCPWKRAVEWVDAELVRDETGLCTRRHPATREPLCTSLKDVASITPVDGRYILCDGCNGNGTWATRKADST